MKRFALVTLIAWGILPVVPCPVSGQGVITTVAGTDFTFPTNVTLATNAPLGRLEGVAVDSQGNVYGADSDNNLVVQINPQGIIRVVAGNAIGGFSGDGGPATSASLSLGFASGVALDSSGNLYIADTYNGRVRMVSANGIITTVAGSGNYGFSGDGGPATSASLENPTGIVVDTSGNLFISDSYNNRIRKVSANGVIVTIAGNGSYGSTGDGGPATSAGLSNPNGLAVDTSGDLFIADTNGNKVRKVSASGVITTVAGCGCTGGADGGPATSASMYPTAVTLDSFGNLFIADADTSRARKVSPNGLITTVAGNGIEGFSGDGGPATSASLNYPEGIAVDASGNLFIGDGDNDRIRRVSAGGVITTVAGNGNYRFSGDGGPATSAALNFTSEFAEQGKLVVSPLGDIFLADSANNRIREVSDSGVITTVAGGNPGFSGDGGPATSASLNNPSGVALDASGDLYIADAYNNRIRKVSADGVIITVAGTGQYGFSGDGGPATAAQLWNPTGVAVDASGNLFIADGYNNRIRKVSTNGVIATVAGNGPSAFSGDGGLATAASLFLQDTGNRAGGSVAVDSAGNLFIADIGNNRIRKVTTTGVITTVAGNGTANFSGDGGPAVSASLSLPAAVVVDASDNLFIADSGNYRVREVSGGVITTVAGDGQGGYSGDGGSATSASVSYPLGVAVNAAGNLFIADLSDHVREVLTTFPAFTVSPSSLNLSLTAGDSSGVGVQINLASAPAGVVWSASASAPWITLSPASGTAPTAIRVAVNAVALQPGAYPGSIVISNPLASPAQETVNVILTVTAATPKLAVAPSAVSFQIQQGAAAQSQTVTVSSAGGGALNWTVQGSSASPWISVSPTAGSASVAANSSLQVTANPAGLSPGVYTGTITVSGAGTSATVTVNLLVTPAAPTLLLSQAGLTFTGIAGGGVVPPQTFGVLNVGGGSMNWTATATTATSWLTLSPTSGTSVVSSTSPPMVTVGADATNLIAGKYTAQIQISAPGATNTPQLVTVILNVLSQGSALPPIVRPTGLIFVRQTGTSSPSSQTVTLNTAQPGTIQAIVNPPALVQDQISQSVVASPLTIAPLTPTFSPGNSNQIVVQPNLGSLTPGDYFGAFTVTTGETVQTVNVLFVVTSGLTNSASPDGSAHPTSQRTGAAATACAPLFVTAQSLGNNFSSPVGYPQDINAQVVDDCNNPTNGATVIAIFSSGDPPLALVGLGNGVYEGSWFPGSAAAQVTVTVSATLGSLTGSTTIPGQVTGQSAIPPTFTNGASFAANGPLAPGSIVSAFWQNPAAATASATTLPLSTSLGGVQLSIGGRNVPLFYASSLQVNAQIPLDVTPNSSTTAAFTVTQAGGPTLTAPQTLTVSLASPGIFLTQGQAVITDANGDLINSNNPASPGQVVVIYATGLGPVNQTIALGAPSPANPPATVNTPVQVTIGGQTVTPQFAGLTPNFVGLYQVNVAIPTGVTPGSAVPVAIVQNGVSSNAAPTVVK
jgi:uncharacterized protein (TIGR03437 family)